MKIIFDIFNTGTGRMYCENKDCRNYGLLAALGIPSDTEDIDEQQ